MTSRFFRRAISWEAYRARIDLVPPPGVDPPEAAWNIAPGQIAPIIRRAPEGEDVARGALQMAPAIWGLVPSWWSKPLSEKRYASHNARAETAHESPSFRGAWRHGRCLVPASGFYAWSGPKGASTPFSVALRDRDWFCFAGLWSRTMIEGSEIDTFAVLTTDPNDLMAGIAASMPVILAPQHHLRWLDPAAGGEEALLRPYPVEGIRTWPANPAVGNVRNQGPDLVGEGDP